MSIVRLGLPPLRGTEALMVPNSKCLTLRYRTATSTTLRRSPQTQRSIQSFESHTTTLLSSPHTPTAAVLSSSRPTQRYSPSALQPPLPSPSSVSSSNHSLLASNHSVPPPLRRQRKQRPKKFTAFTTSQNASPVPHQLYQLQPLHP